MDHRSRRITWERGRIVRDYRDIVIEMLADSETMLLGWIGELISEREAYQTVAQQAIHHCHAQYVQLTHLRANHDRLITEYRVLRKLIIASDLESM